MAAQHIHSSHDGLGLREVFLNGKPLKYCFFADTKKGKARCYRHPFTTDKYKKRLLSKTVRGEVSVVWL